MNNLVKSPLLISVPRSKLEERREDIVAKCKCCSKNDIKSGVGVCGECNIKIQAIQRQWEANIPFVYWDLSMKKDFAGCKPLLDKYNELDGDWIKVFREGKSFLVSGGHGVGKTMFACDILRQAVYKGRSGAYITLSDMVGVLTGAEYNEQLVVRRFLQMVDVLVIDEMDGRFVSSQGSNDLFARNLENILRTRLSNKLCNIVISNSPNVIEMLNGALKESLGSLFNLLERIIVLGDDARKTN